jgi:hypothetical protein
MTDVLRRTGQCPRPRGGLACQRPPHSNQPKRTVVPVSSWCSANRSASAFIIEIPRPRILSSIEGGCHLPWSDTTTYTMPPGCTWPANTTAVVGLSRGVRQACSIAFAAASLTARTMSCASSTPRSAAAVHSAHVGNRRAANDREESSIKPRTPVHNGLARSGKIMMGPPARLFYGDASRRGPANDSLPHDT